MAVDAGRLLCFDSIPISIIPLEHGSGKSNLFQCRVIMFNHVRLQDGLHPLLTGQRRR